MQSQDRMLRDRCAVGHDERIHTYRRSAGKAFHLISVDATSESTTVIAAPCEPDVEPLAIAACSDGAVYVGTGTAGLLVRFTGSDASLLPCPIPEQTHITSLGSHEGELYGGTAPDGHLFRLDFETGAFTDCGRMQPGQPVLRHMLVDLDGQIYCGLGPEESHLIRFDPRTNHRTELLPRIYQTEGFPRPAMGTDEVVYTILGDEIFEIEDTACIPLFPIDYPGEVPLATPSGIRIVSVDIDALTIVDDDGERRIPLPDAP